jgi:hypothetical protein
MRNPVIQVSIPPHDLYMLKDLAEYKDEPTAAIARRIIQEAIAKQSKTEQ